VLDLGPNALEVDHHRVEAAPLPAALETLRHHQPKHHVKEESETLDEKQQQKYDSHPQHVDVKPFGEACAHTAQDPVVAAVEPLISHVLMFAP
jgi:hypothetical protein